MLELTTLTVFISYIVYLRYYADQRTNAQKEADRLREGIDLYSSGRFAEALTYFNAELVSHPKSGVAYLYRANSYRALGDPTAALSDLDQGKSYDDTIADLHLESGKIHYEQSDYQRAFLDFDKAVFYDRDNQAAPYHWRGLARQQLHQDDLSRQDLQRAEVLSKAQPVASTELPVRSAFFDRRLLLHMGLIVLSTLLLLLVIKRSTVIHWPYLTAAILGASIGFLEPRKGWVLALQQVLLLWLGYTFIAGPATSGTQREVEAFSLYGSIGLTFVGSLLGSVIRRAYR